MARTIYLLRRGMQLPNESSFLIGAREFQTAIRLPEDREI